MPIPLSNNPGGYSWLGVSAPTNFESRKNSSKETKRFKESCAHLEQDVFFLKKKLERYNCLCTRYQELAGTAKDSFLLRQMESLKEEIDHLSKDLFQVLDETVSIIHSTDSKQN